ncbi:hypothetical protein PRIPAC_95721 [Pristionchus pacificus]|uniref:Uncharacterized protein n=1 Tax=Pristionchus pacificus TaxID=54126 RepID=A0A454Y3B6_PRIPA|nr:hypothetical protein PRIPAC_95721 [Pristionchus pacificus]|eukprot:PDM77467.1 hypothetical protein PRIPAC_33197 [Pristionchus pacificus]
MARTKIDHYRSETQRKAAKDRMQAILDSMKEISRRREEESAAARLQEDNERRRAENEAAIQAGEDVAPDRHIWNAGEKFRVLELRDIEYCHRTGTVQVEVFYDGDWDPADNPKWEDLTREHISNPAFRPLVTNKWKANRGFNSEMLDILESLDVFVNTNGTVYSELMDEEDDDFEVRSRRRKKAKKSRN